MTIHTFEVSSVVKGNDYYLIQKDLKRLSPSEWQATNAGMTCWAIKGVVIVMSVIKKNGFYLQ